MSLSYTLTGHRDIGVYLHRLDEGPGIDVGGPARNQMGHSIWWAESVVRWRMQAGMLGVTRCACSWPTPASRLSLREVTLDPPVLGGLCAPEMTTEAGVSQPAYLLSRLKRTSA